MSNDVLAKVQGILAELFDVDPQSLSLETKANDISEWDSVGHLSLCGALEEVFDVRFTVSDFAEIDSVQAIVSLIESKRPSSCSGRPVEEAIGRPF
jgi:acyl carrier protein